MPPDLSHPLPIVDSHLDLAENVTRAGRDLTVSVRSIRAQEQRTANQATVSLPELERGGIAIAFATVTAGLQPSAYEVPSASTSSVHAAEAHALSQIDLYERWEQQGRVRIVKSVADLEHHLTLWQDDRKPGLVLLMEGAEPIVSPRDLPLWWRRGLRMIGLTWADTRYGKGVGTGSTVFRQGGLTQAGRALLEGMAEQGFIWDISHLAEDGVGQGFDLKIPRVCATHATARALTPTDRHLSDDVIRAIAQQSGVIGLVLYNGFLEHRWEHDASIPVTLAEHAKRHATYLAGLVGWQHVGIGSDLDGGLGLEESPQEIDTVADLYKVGDVVPAEVREGVLSTNWLRFLRRSLPARS
jgi:Zn-dependent dipeptidase, microsomal dipeptidase homolog